MLFLDYVVLGMYMFLVLLRVINFDFCNSTVGRFSLIQYINDIMEIPTVNQNQKLQV